MNRRNTWATLFASPLLLIACKKDPPINQACADLNPAVSGTAIQLQTIANNLDTPVYLAAPNGDAERLFIVQQPGQIVLFKNGVQTAAPFLDINERVGFDGAERGLFSIAFHPDFATNGKFYVDYTDNNGDINVSEFTAAGGGDVADPNSERNLLVIEHSQFGNHNGGLVKMGPDGFLYIGVGDGGSANDPFAAGQQTTDNAATPADQANEAQLGKLLRIDVNTGDPAPGNPFGNEIFDFGLRNPWRFSFDRETGDLYIGDVGQNAIEEVDFKAAGGNGVPAPGTNWGWSELEGTDVIGVDPNNDTLPVLEFNHNNGACSVIGGYAYRGGALPDLEGTYYYGDLCEGFIRTFQIANGQVTNEQDVTAQIGVQALVSFGEDGCGELYVVDILGEVSKIVPAQ